MILCIPPAFTMRQYQIDAQRRMTLTLSQTSLVFYMYAVKVFKTLGKGEIARFEQFLLVPQCFLPF